MRLRPGPRVDCAADDVQRREEREPLRRDQVVEFRAVKEAAADVAQNYGISEKKATRIIGAIVAKYSE